MIKYFENIKFIKSDTSLGVHVRINSDSKYDIAVVEVNKKKESLEIVSKKDSLSAISEIKDFNKSNSPVNLTITGKGILSKTIKISSSEEQNSVINRVFPNISLKEFYVQKNNIDQDLYFISIVRKSLVDEIIQDFEKNNIFISNLTIAPFVIQNILPVINTEQLELPGFSILITDHIVREIKNTDNSNLALSYKIGTTDLESKYLIPYANAINYFINDSVQESNLNELILDSKNEYTAKKLFTYGGWGILLFVLIILLVNYMFFMKFQSNRDHLSSQLQFHKNSITQLKEYKSELERKSSFLSKNKILSSSRISYYADQIALRLPKEITLTKLDIFPLEKRLKSKQEAVFIYNEIIIEGLTENGIILNNWIKELKKLDWIMRIEITSYSQEDLKAGGEFSIEIILNTNQ